jgi:uncharacterized membrane protein
VSHRPAKRAAAALSLGVILAATVATLTIGAVVKQPCAAGDWGDGRQYKRLCYSDIVPLYGTEQLTGGRLPYLQECRSGSGQCDEYPVLTMYFMRLAAWIGHGYAAFFYVNEILLAVCALGAAWALYRVAGERALYVALAPTLLIYAFVNWDLLAVALTAAGTVAFLRNRDATAGALIGLGAASKAYPALLLVPFILERLRQRRRDGTARLALGAVVAYTAVNLPFAVAAPHAWSTFFRFNSARPVDWDSAWFVACQRLHGGTGCPWSPRLINFVSGAVFVALTVAVYLAKRARHPDFPRWTMAFPVLVLFLLTNKVYSPQYGLWLLPWFALALPSPWLFAAFEAADVAVFVTRFTWFGRLSAASGDPAFAGFHGTPLGGFEIAAMLRAAVLVACVVLWIMRREPDRATPLRPPAAEPPAIRTAPSTAPETSGQPPLPSRDWSSGTR